VRITHEYGLNICAHVILGLPGETREMMLDTARFIAGLPIDGVKIHSLYITRGTALATLHEKGEYKCLDRDEYVETVIDFLEILPSELVIQRLTGDPFRAELVAPLWMLEKTRNMNLIEKRMRERDTWQGKKNK
jgi:radical SAM protein (TIGR01212 family)